MTLADRLPKLPASRWVTLAGFALIVGLVLAAFSVANTMKKQEMAHWEQQMGGMSLVLSEQMTESLVPVSEVLAELANYAYRNGVRDEQSFNQVLSTFQAYSTLKEAIGSLTLVDVATFVAHNGDNINFTRSYPVPKINLADRDYFQHHASTPGDQEFVSKPVRNKGNGQWTFYMSRRISASDGRFLGVVLVGISVSRIMAFHEKVAAHLGPNAAITLFRNDLTMMSRWPAIDSVIGKTPSTGTAHHIVKRLGKTEGTVVTNEARVSNGRTDARMGSLRQVRRYPLMILTVITEDVYLATTQRAVKAIALVTTIACSLLGIGLFALVRSLRKGEQNVEEMRHLQMEAEQASQAKSGFLATMSHEIRTPMNGILGMAQLMQLPGVSEAERQNYARTIIHSGRNLMSLLNDILDFSKMDAGKLSLHCEPCGIVPLMEDCVRLFEPSARAKGLELTWAWEGLPTEGYELDSTRVRQMINNLLNNAIKFSHEGRIHLRGWSVQLKDGPSTLRFEVSDQGIGISEADEQQLFKPFTQLDSSTTRRFGGTGLGLSTVRGLAELMGGQTGLLRHEGPGTTFWFTLQAQPTSQFPDDLPALAHGTANNFAHRLLILVAEDDRTNQMVITAMLDKAGYDVRHAENGLIAVQAATTQPRPALVLMDLQMPEMDGLAASQAIRLWESTHQQAALPIVALTAAAQPIQRDLCLQAGMNDFLTKPVMMDALRHILDKHLHRPPAL